MIFLHLSKTPLSLDPACLLLITEQTIFESIASYGHRLLLIQCFIGLYVYTEEVRLWLEGDSKNAASISAWSARDNTFKLWKGYTPAHINSILSQCDARRSSSQEAEG